MFRLVLIAIFGIIGLLNIPSGIVGLIKFFQGDAGGILLASICLVPLIIASLALHSIISEGSEGSGYSDYDPMEDKRAHYNKDGEIIGYSDKD